ncbi:hypothetical protein B0H10DRAFT_2202662 [Mycena sp. CBHHK59/15]|nr:hypothetical protein B0H10DRAFT_2202662 [Mycena sp. CBHHK59/15]
MIDVIQQGDVPWQSFSVTYTGPLPESGEVPAWMTEKYEVWFRSPLGIFEKQLANPDFKDEMDWAPKRIFKGGKRQYVDLFFGNWVWEQADKIAKDENTHGTMFVPSVLGSDKTTVSIGAGNTGFYPLYGGVGNIYNSTRDQRSFRKYDGHFRRVIYGLGPYIADYPEQALLTSIVQGWCPRCLSPATDLDQPSVSHSHEHTDALMEGCTLKELWDDFRIVRDIVVSQVSVFSVQNPNNFYLPAIHHWFPRADIHELISMDLLRQVIKGTFKDNIVNWVEEYIRAEHEKPEADRILVDIDRRIATTPPFPGLQHFHFGRGYKQWTGNDSKGLMKMRSIYPPLQDTYQARSSKPLQILLSFAILPDTLIPIDAVVARFHLHREVFRDTVRPEGFSLPHQHSIVHYRVLIQLFGAPNGLCSSITESKHIKAVERPYRRTSHNKPLSQMLLTNQRLDKLAVASVDFTARGTMDGTLLPLPPPPPRDSLPPPPENPDDECFDHGAMDGPTCIGEVKLAKTYGGQFLSSSLAIVFLSSPQFVESLMMWIAWLYTWTSHNELLDGYFNTIGTKFCPSVVLQAVFYALSDVSSVGGMHHEHIRATKSWYHGPPRNDCVFLEHDKDLPGFHGLHTAHVHMLF